MPARPPRVEIYQSANDGLWYWRLWMPNGKLQADGGQGYASRSNARRACRRMARADVARAFADASRPD